MTYSSWKAKITLFLNFWKNSGNFVVLVCWYQYKPVHLNINNKTQEFKVTQNLPRLINAWKTYLFWRLMKNLKHTFTSFSDSWLDLLQKWSRLTSDSHLPKKLFYLVQRKLFKNDENCFLFHLKSTFPSEDIF